jgi:hypothetical protein
VSSLKLSINNHDLAEAFFEDTRLLGIMAPMKDYLFCWQLNSLLGLDFRINHELEIGLKKRNGTIFFRFLNTMNRLGPYVITCTTMNLKESIYCRNSNTWIFCG